MKDKTRTKEIVCYSIFGTIWLGGLVICCLGVYAYNGIGKLAYNPIFQAQKNLTSFLNWPTMIDFRILGSIICLISMCFLIGFLYHFANRTDKTNSRKSKQLEKLKKMIEEDSKQIEKEDSTKVETENAVSSN